MSEEEIIQENAGKSAKNPTRVSQEQIHGILFGDRLSWQSIIYDLINTEQLDPWDIDISLLAGKYMEKVRALEEANFFVSSKVLLAASLLLRMKSEILLNEDLQSLDDILFGKKEEKKQYVQERIDLDEDIPGLIARTPLPRFRKVSLEELMGALNKAIATENRRIRKIVTARQQEFETQAVMPRHKINIKDRIKEVYSRLRSIFSEREEKLAFSEFSGRSSQERISTFIPLLHLDSQHRVWLEQEGHFEEIWILLKEAYEKQNKGKLEEMRKEAEAEIGKMENNLDDEAAGRIDKIDNEFANPLGELGF